jgi:glycine dehydrogenase subunit 2
VHEALMVEPTETESKQTLDEAAAKLLQIAEEARREPALVTGAPRSTPVGRLDEVRAARTPDLGFRAPDDRR